MTVLNLQHWPHAACPAQHCTAQQLLPRLPKPCTRVPRLPKPCTMSAWHTRLNFKTRYFYVPVMQSRLATATASWLLPLLLLPICCHCYCHWPETLLLLLPLLLPQSMLQLHGWRHCYCHCLVTLPLHRYWILLALNRYCRYCQAGRPSYCHICSLLAGYTATATAVAAAAATATVAATAAATASCAPS